MILPILLYKNKILRNKNKNIKIKSNLNNIINNMFDTMYYYKGIGLSAPQIGKNINLFIISINNKKLIFINSKIKSYSKKKIISNEGCLSIPNIYVNIKRKKLINVEYYDNKWKKHKKIFNNYLSIIFQHEYDHIRGKLIIDYLKKN
ncbi:peptide deformylase [Candidatus Shikimatogenerans bostrichidophilus]|uniref:peptide deformylase n=1 Tax=Candidatus Shikimatogenerans bostrichidophilus TaxID=2943807 RepID=UPI002966FA8F